MQGEEVYEPAIDLVEREEEAEKEQECYHCAHCNVTLSLWNLTRHEGSKRHQNKTARKEIGHHCEACNASFKSIQALKRHEQTMKHQDKVDPEGAEPKKKVRVAEAQAKRDVKETARKAGERETARKAGERETARKASDKETARKAGDKEKHRKAARDQSNNNMKRKRSKADKDAKQRAFSIIQYRKQTERDPAPWVSGDGTEEDALKALVRYHGSTNVAMLLHTDNERIKSNIRKFVRVSPEVKATMRKTWQEGEMATSRAYYSCASCGIRDHGNYAQKNVADLPDFFKFSEKNQAMFDVLKGVLICFNFVSLLCYNSFAEDGCHARFMHFCALIEVFSIAIIILSGYSSGRGLKAPPFPKCTVARLFRLL